MKNCNGCPWRTTRTTKYGVYDWCKKNGSGVSSPRNPCKGLSCPENPRKGRVTSASSGT